MEYKDYYDLLGVARDASQAEIKRAYRKLARKYHPDVSSESDAEERFKAVGEAYEVLKDPEKRTAYDQLGRRWEAGEEFRPPPDWDAGFEFSGGGFTESDAGGFSDFFESLFGRGPGQPEARRSARQARGDDHFAKILIGLDDAYRGATRQITLHAPEVTADGHVTTKERTLNVKIPTGVRPGQQIRLVGQGHTGAGQAGDLYLEVAFEPHPIYRVDGGDVYLDLPVAPWEAALGATVKVPTPAGPVDLKIPAGSRQGGKLRLRGRGLPGSPSGDLYVVLTIVLPPADSERAKSVYQQMSELPFSPRGNLGV